MLPLLFSLLACGRAERSTHQVVSEEALEALGYRQPPPEPDWPLPKRLPLLTWSVVEEDDALAITYDVVNLGQEDIWLLDRVPDWEGDPTAEDPEAIFVQNGRRPGSARLFRGFSQIGSCFTEATQLRARRVAPGGRVEGHARVALPLRSSTPVHADLELAPDIDTLELEIAWTMNAPGQPVLPDDPLAWPAVDPWSGLLRQRWLTGAPLPLP